MVIYYSQTVHLITTKCNDFYRGGSSMKKFCSVTRRHTAEITNFQKDEMLSLKAKQEEEYTKQNLCLICKGEFHDVNAVKNSFSVWDHCHYTGKFRGANRSICNLKYKAPKEISVVFHYVSNCDYHLIIKKLVEEFKGQFECLEENTEKYIICSVTINKIKSNKTKTYKIKFIDNVRFMSSLLPSLINNLAQRLSSDCRLIVCVLQRNTEHLHPNV